MEVSGILWKFGEREFWKIGKIMWFVKEVKENKEEEKERNYKKENIFFGLKN